ncbi:Glyco_tranf_GTA_type domain containing protein [Candidatus Methylopumilus universalis]
MKKKLDYTFVVLSYNHENYILEHLESIKFQIKNFGVKYSIDLIVADDCSKDNTVYLAKLWISKNRFLFRSVTFTGKSKNVGTCINYTNTWKKIKTTSFKITASDDVYSKENIFKYNKYLKSCDLISCLPLHLLDKKLFFNKWEIFEIISSDVIYKHYIERIKKISNFNAPNLFFDRKVIDNEKIYKFIRRFKVTEDYPMQIMLGEVISEPKVMQTTNVAVYYRRTTNSTYIIKNNDFYNDKNRIFKYLIKVEPDQMSKFFILNRIFCLNIRYKFLSRILNFNIYFFFIKVILNFMKIMKIFKSVDINLNSHQLYYQNICNKAAIFSKLYALDITRET